MKTLNWLQEKVGAWHRRTFGEFDPAEHLRALGTKAAEEGRKASDDPSMEAAADLIICALAIADRHEEYLTPYVERKLAALEERGGVPIAGDEGGAE